MKKNICSLVALALIVSGIAAPGPISDRGVVSPAAVWAAGWSKEPDVIYVPTPMKVVAKMLDMVGVDRDDVVYDLGCGDGRIVIAAAKQRGARGIGIDVDPVRIRESKENARMAGVDDRVTFLNQDLFESDLSEASVVTLYLLSSLNLKLRPKLLSELKPGTRVVSHFFSMGEWVADETATVDGHRIYVWVIPENVSGTWQWRAAGPEGSAPFRLELRQRFQEIEGTVETEGEMLPIENTMLQGDRLAFTVTRRVEGRPVAMRYEGRVQGNIIEGRRITQTGGGENTTWRAERDPASIEPLDALNPFQQARLRDTLPSNRGARFGATCKQ